MRDVMHMGQLIRQLLTLAQIEGRTLKLAREDLAKLARARAEDLTPLAMVKGIELAFVAPDTPVWAEINVAHAGEAIGNIIDNAIRYSPKGAIVDVRVLRDASIEIADRGPGIAAERRKGLFKRVWQDSGREDGAGLGLAIAGEIMRQHRGSASATPRKGGGSCFQLRFEAAAEAPDR